MHTATVRKEAHGIAGSTNGTRIVTRRRKLITAIAVIAAIAVLLGLLPAGYHMVRQMAMPRSQDRVIELRVTELLDEIRHLPGRGDIWLHRLGLSRRVNWMGAKDTGATERELVKLGTAAAPRLRKAARDDAYGPVRCAAINVLLEMGDPAIGDILREIYHKREMPQFVIQRLAWKRRGAPLPLPRSEAVAYLSSDMKDESVGVRIEAAMGLGNLGDPASAEVLLAGLRDAHCHVRMYSASALGKLGNPRFLPVLREIAENDKFLGTRRDAKRAIQRIERALASSQTQPATQPQQP